jgi:hypothetical protein
MLVVNHEPLVFRMSKVDRIRLVHCMLLSHWMPREGCKLPMDCVSSRLALMVDICAFQEPQ